MPNTTINERPYWWDIGLPESSPSTPLRPAYDIAIIGAGYTGLSAALYLARAGRSVAVLEKNLPGAAASGRNGGMTSGTLRPSFSYLIKQAGLEAAKTLYSEARAARQDLYRFIREENIDCDLQETGRFSGAICPAHYERLARDADALNKHLGFAIETVSRAEQQRETGSQLYHGGVIWPDVGGLQPLKLQNAYLRKTLDAGAEVHSETAVLGFEPEQNSVRIKTTRGILSARDLIVATNAYTDGADPWLRRRLVPVLSRIIATEPLSKDLMSAIMPSRRMYTETGEMGHYYRPSPDGTRLLLGGRGSPLRDAPERDTARLQAELVALFPQLAGTGLTHSWSGQVAFNRDDVPRMFRHSGIHYAVGYCGSGVVWARWAGKLTALAILGEAAVKSALDFRPPAAVPLYRGTPWFLPAFFAWFRYKDQRALKSASKKPA